MRRRPADERPPREPEGDEPPAAAGAPQTLVVPEGAKGQRVDQFLAAALGAATGVPSRATVQRWMREGAVTDGGRSVAPSERARPGAVLVIVRPPEMRSTATPDAAVEFTTLHVDADIVVVDKPAGLVVHPARGHAAGTLVNGLLARGYFDAALADERDAEGHLRPGIVHRLDAGTAGVMVVARNAVAREALKAQFQAHTIERAYEALALGVATARTHATLHGRHPTDRLRFSTRVRDGKRAVTHVELLERFGDVASHVRCRLETGRTHQIRVHLAESGTPIVGDPLYGKVPRDPALRAVADALGHQALVARVLGFVHPRSGVAMRFEVALPADFERARDALRVLAGQRAR